MMKGNVKWLLWFASIAASATAQPPDKAGFDGKEALSAWSISGDVSIDSSKDRSGQAGGSLRVGPGGKAVWTLRDADGAGRVDLWVCEDMKTAKDPKERRVGPRWGLIQKDGHVLVMGVFYAPYLGGDKSYTASDSDQKIWFNVQHTRVKRQDGWRRWTFDFDPAAGLSILCDDKNTSFDWNKTKMAGFAGVAIFGDSGQDDPQTIWVDDVEIRPAGPVEAKPVPPPPIVPDKDPAPDKPVDLLPAVKSQHPRLLFSAADLPAMKQRAQGPSRVFFDRLMEYLPSCKPPDNTSYQKDATDAQRQGMWRLPTVALHYALTGDKNSFNNALGFLKAFLAAENWETGKERDSGMAAANIMVGAALAYDWLYNDLDPQFREAFRRKLLLQARRMYYGGHLQKLSGQHYWQQDPENNHRFHRDAGLALSVLAVASDAPDDDWILGKTLEELQFVHDWLPPDGTCHESPSYMIFGNPYLHLAMDASDRCLGTKFLDHSFFKNNPMFRMQTLTPGLKEVFCYGDCGGTGFINDSAFLCTAHFKLRDEQSALLDFRQAAPNAFSYGWVGLVWFDPAIAGGSIGNLPKNKFFPNLGAAFMRDGWEAKNAGAMFKCGPYGGFKLNEFRNARDFAYINVAHDDPDANMFIIYANGQILADDDRYSRHKVTSSHNTILVNGTGQRGEGGGWMQPIKNVDMNRLAYPVAWKATDDATLAEGEASGAYDGLERFRRTFIWVKSSYILILDDIRAANSSEIAWLVQGAGAQIVDEPQRLFRLTNQDAQCDFRVASNCSFKAAVAESTADSHGKALGYKQIQLTAQTNQWRLATVFDPWSVGGVQVNMTESGPDGATVVVSGPNFTDAWDWPAPVDNVTATALKGQRQGGFSIALTAQDRIPQPEWKPSAGRAGLGGGEKGRHRAEKAGSGTKAGMKKEGKRGRDQRGAGPG